MTYVDSVDCDELRIILCLEFEQHASPTEVSALKSAMIDSANTLHSIESTGAFHFVVEVAPPDLAWWNKWLKTLASPFAKLVARCETSFVCKRFIRREKGERPLWVPTANGLMRIEQSAVDKIVANGDYVQVVSNGQQWLLHATMHGLRGMLGSPHFVQLHRSMIVRRGFIDRLSRSGRQWTAELSDGTSERVARTHVAELLEATRLATAEPESSNVVQLGDGNRLRSAKS
jgi:hypothetical protein